MTTLTPAFHAAPYRPLHRALIGTVILVALSACTGPTTRSQGFASPESTVQALVSAVRAGQSGDVVAVLGPGATDLVYSGDDVADRISQDRFIAYYDEAHTIRMDGDDRATLVIGEKQWPFPIPVVRHGNTWRFDTAAGREEILNRRIGRNELDAIQVCRAIVDAQRDYAQRFRDEDGIVQYAARLVSSQGMRDGLYWPVTSGEAESPIGPLLARAREEGYGVDDDYGEHEPYHGYFYKMLLRQDGSATGGAYEYVVDGRMIGGFALVAFPAGYGTSGIMTFIVNQDGIVYQANLGQDTVDIARAMESFDPDDSWSRVPEDSRSE